MTFRLWGKGKTVTATDTESDEGKDENKGAKSPTAESEDEDEEEEEEARERKDGDEEEEDEEAKALTAATTAAAKVSPDGRAGVIHVERHRIAAIVNGAGRDRVAQALHVALNTDMAVEKAVAFLEETPGEAPAASGGRLGLDRGMRRTPAIGADGGNQNNGGNKEVNDLAASVLAHVPGRQKK